MPKFCEFCNQPYPDHLAACPQCSIFQAPAGPIDPDMDVELGGPPTGKKAPPGEITDVTLDVSWMDAPAGASEVNLGGEPSVRFDAFSDQDILQHVQPGPIGEPPATLNPWEPPQTKVTPGELDPGALGRLDSPTKIIPGPKGAPQVPSQPPAPAAAPPPAPMAEFVKPEGTQVTTGALDIAALQRLEAAPVPATRVPEPVSPSPLMAKAVGGPAPIAPDAGQGAAATYMRGGPAPATMVGGGPTPATMVAGGVGPAAGTMVAGQAAPTMVASPEALAAAPGQAAPTMAAGGAAKPTMAAGGAAAPTMVGAGLAAATMMAAQSPDPTMIAPAAPPTMLTPPDQGPMDVVPVAEAKPAVPGPTLLARAADQALASHSDEALGFELAEEEVKKTMVPQPASPTMMPPAPGPTMLTQEGPLELPGGEGGAKKTTIPQPASKTMMPPTPGPTMLTQEGPLELPGGEGGAKKTTIPQPASKTMIPPTPGPTMLTQEEPFDLPAGEGGPKKTMLPQQAAKTMMPPTPGPTMLTQEEPFDLPASEGGPKKTMMPPQPAKTMMPPAPAKTMLTQDEPFDLPAGEGGPKKTMMPPQPAKTMMPPAPAKTMLTQDEPFDLPAEQSKKTMMPPQPAKTMMPPTPGPTMLTQEEPFDLPTVEGGPKKTMMPPQAAKTMLPPTPSKTMLTEEAPFELPGDAKKTMLPKPPAPTILSDEEPFELPSKKTMLPSAPQPTMLTPEGETEPFELPEEGPKRTMLPKSAGDPTKLAQPHFPTMLASAEESEPLPMPEEGEGMEAINLGAAAGGLEASSLSGAMARALLEGGTVPEEGRKLSTLDLAQLSTVGAAPSSMVAVKPRYGRRWLGGMLVGLILCGAVLAALFFVPREYTKDLLRAAGLNWMDGTSSTGADPLKEAIAALENGDFQRSLELNKESDQDTADHRAARGEARWMLYLQEQHSKDLPVRKKDERVQQAVKELQAANTARATYWLGHIEEATNDPKASDVFKAGETAHPEYWPFPAGRTRVEVSRAQDKKEPVIPDERKKKAPDAPMEKKAPDVPMEKKAPDVDKKAPDDGKKMEDKKAPDADKKAPDPMDKKEEDKKDGKDKAPEKMSRATIDLLGLLLTALQNDGKGAAGAKGPAGDEEAGAKFWEAVRYAQNHDYDKALEALQKARDTHDKRRWRLLRKPQNPLSDPEEKIFLQTCEDLKTYYEIRKRLHKAYPIAGNDTLASLEALFKAQQNPNDALKEMSQTLAKALDLPDSANRNEIEKKVSELKMTVEGVKGELKKGEYITEEKTDVTKGTEAAVKDAASKQVVAKVATLLQGAGVAEPDPEKGLGLLITQRNDLTQARLDVAKRLNEAGYLDDKNNVAKIPEALDKAIDAATSPLVAAVARSVSELSKLTGATALSGVPTIDMTAQLLASQATITQLQFALAQSRDHKQMVRFWVSVLENRDRKDVLEAAAKDVKSVLKDESATPEEKAIAHCVQGLVNRNSGNFDEARTELQEALKGKEGAKEEAWQAVCERALKELTDPNVYYLPRARELHSARRLDQAIELLQTTEKVFPKEGRVPALRSLVKLDLALAKGKLDAKDPLVSEAITDGKNAFDLGALAEGNYAQGRVAEELGDRFTAEKLYRDALNAALKASADDEAKARFRVALGRVLLRPLKQGILPVPPPAPAPEPKPAKEVGQLPADPTVLLVLLTTAAVTDDDPDSDPGLDEIILLAEQAIKAKNYEGYLIKAQALARKGLWTQALQEYVEGLKRLIKPEYANGLYEIVDNHPAFQLPDSLRNPDPQTAEKHYAVGLQHYFAGRYQKAEDELIEAVRNQGQDARYHYYLGLARLAQRGKRSQANVSFQMGSLLERQNKPGPNVVGASLERVQGSNRELLNGFRDRPGRQ